MNHSAPAVYLITGASRGLGAALARRLDGDGASLFLVARGSIEVVYADAEICQADLSDPASSATVLSAFESFLRDRDFRSVTLINNAGTVSPICPAARAAVEDVDSSIRLNLVAPMLLTGGFIRLLAGYDGRKRVVNISSGASSSPYAGWSTYCASKAGLVMYTRCVGIEQRSESRPVTVVTLAPGVVDTAMQGEIRESRAEDFPMIDKFTDLKASGRMPTPEQVASRIVRFLDSHDLEHGGDYDLRDL